MRVQCRSCATVLKEVTAFCPRCGVPTEHASPDQVRSYELDQWRRHQDGGPVATAVQAPVIETPRAPAHNSGVVRRRAKPAREARPVRNRDTRPELATHTPDPSSEFHYTACTSCEKTDWIVRTGRNEDDSWRYWCVRCSRAFKTDALLPHGRKPFVAAGGILAALGIIATIL